MSNAELAPEGRRGLWAAFTRFRRTRPFWGCVFLAAGGYFVMKPMLGGSFQMLMHLGVGGASVYILGGGMVAAALVAFFVPAQRHFPALMAMVFSVASLPLANLGGWLVGMMLGILGSGLVFAWTPYSEKQLARFAERDARKAQQKADRQAQKQHKQDGLGAAA
jgi:hypothetical protein